MIMTTMSSLIRARIARRTARRRCRRGGGQHDAEARPGALFEAPRPRAPSCSACVIAAWGCSSEIDATIGMIKSSMMIRSSRASKIVTRCGTGRGGFGAENVKREETEDVSWARRRGQSKPRSTVLRTRGGAHSLEEDGARPSPQRPGVDHKATAGPVTRTCRARAGEKTAEVRRFEERRPLRPNRNCRCRPRRRRRRLPYEPYTIPTVVRSEIRAASTSRPLISPPHNGDGPPEARAPGRRLLPLLCWLLPPSSRALTSPGQPAPCSSGRSATPPRSARSSRGCSRGTP